MKKAVSIVLICVLIMGMCAGCASKEKSKEEVKDAIIRQTWFGNLRDGDSWVEYTVRFSNDWTASVSVTRGSDGSFAGSGNNLHYVPGPMIDKNYKGPFEINNKQIIISDDGVDIFIDYSFKNGTISMEVDDVAGKIPLKVKTGS